MTDTRWYATRSAAAAVEMSEQHIKRAIRAGELPAKRAGSAGYRIRATDLDEWMERTYDSA